jgi:diguanylate cyclase (GGDEF)-like protein
MRFFFRADTFAQIRQRWASLTYFMPAVLALLAVGFMIVRIDLDEQHRNDENLRAAASQQLARLASNLKLNINGNVQLVQGLVAAISISPAVDQDLFARLSERIFRAKSQLRNIAGAPDLVVSLIYPVGPNVKTLGLDYRKNDQQRDAALQAKNAKVPVLTGPIDLVQGGTGLIARYPVYTQEPSEPDHFWGIVSAVIDLEKLYVDSGFEASDLPVDVVIARKSDNRSSRVFFGDARILNHAPVSLSIDLGYDTWTLFATEKGGWEAARPSLLMSRLYSLVIALFIVAPLIWAGYLMKQRQANILALQEREDKLERLSHRLQLALEASKIGVWEYRETSGELIWDSRMRELYSVPADQADCSYSDWRDALHPDDLSEAERVFTRALNEESNYITEFRVLAGAGDIRHIRAYGVTYRDSSGGKKIVGANWDVTKDVLLQKELRDAHAHVEVQNRRLADVSRTLAHQSLHDSLTGLPNRRYLDQYLEQVSPDLRHVFLHVDLDHFKEVNDTLGHAAGDEVLRISASRLLAKLQKGEFAARIGGDEFIVVSPATDPQARGQTLAATILDAFTRPIMAGNTECRIAPSLGVAMQSTQDCDVRQLLINADIALYEAKKLGRNRAEFFTETLRLSAVTLKRTADELLNALDNDEIVPFFQPQFDANTLQVVGVEALARWQHPTRGLLTPDKFLGVAASLNRVAEIDALILEKSLFQATRWAANDFSVPKVSINISAQRLRDARLIERLSTLKIPAGSLSFELLESISFDDHDEQLSGAIQAIKSLGFDIEIDDFGTGHASIVSLLELAPQRLKIDRKLIAPIIDSFSQQRLVSSIIEIGKSLGIEIVAEGVESMAHAEILRDLGCHTLQGYAFARPMSSHDLMDFLRAWPHTRRVPRSAIAATAS